MKINNRFMVAMGLKLMLGVTVLIVSNALYAENAKLEKKEDKKDYSTRVLVIDRENIKELYDLQHYNKLKVLHIVDTDLENLDFLKSLKNIPFEKIYIFDNQKLKDFSALRKLHLKVVILGNNPLLKNTDDLPAGLEQLAIIRTKELTALKLTGFQNISKLYLSDNEKLQEVSLIYKMPKLTELVLDNNAKIDFDYNFLNTLPLEFLELHNTDIQTLPKLNSKTLKCLDLRNNKRLKELHNLNGISLERLSIAKIDGKVLDTMGNNKIKQIFIRNCTSLDFLKKTAEVQDITIFDRYKNPIAISFNVISSCKKLKKLILFNCHNIKNINFLKGLRLKSLKISYSKVKDLSPLIGMELGHLDISDSPIEDLIPLVGIDLDYLIIYNTPAAKLPLPKGLKVKTLIGHSKS